MTIKQREMLQRASGIIEGVSFGVDRKAQDTLLTALTMIDSVLDEQEGEKALAERSGE